MSPPFTIDPFDAKDLDDALSYRKLPNGHHQKGSFLQILPKIRTDSHKLIEEFIAAGQ